MGVDSKNIFIKILSILLFAGIFFGIYYREIIETSLAPNFFAFSRILII